MSSRLLPLEPTVIVNVPDDDHQPPLRLCALEAARGERGLCANIQAVTVSHRFSKFVRFGIPADRYAFCARLMDTLDVPEPQRKQLHADLDRALLEMQIEVEQALRQQETQTQSARTASERDRATDMAEQLVHITQEAADLFLTTRDESFAHVLVEPPVTNHGISPTPDTRYATPVFHRTLPLHGREFRAWLTHRFWLQERKAPSRQALQTALNLLEGLVTCQGSPRRPLHLRLARFGAPNTTSPSLENARMEAEDAKIDFNRQSTIDNRKSDSSFILHPSSFQDGVWLDLADPHFQAIYVTAEGWQIVSDPPPLFRRSPATASLPIPEPQGELQELRACLNLPDDTAWHLLIAWLVAALIPGIPHPILHLSGPQDSGKSCLARILLDLIDPSDTPLLSMPRDAAEWTQTAHSRWAICLDHLTRLPSWLAESLGRAIHGQSLSLHHLPPNLGGRGGEVVLLTSAEELALPAELHSRTLRLDLLPIDPAQRRREADLQQAWQQARPRVFAVLLDLLAAVLNELPTVCLSQTPPLADFAAIGVATERVLGWTEGSWLAAYEANLCRPATVPAAHCHLLELLLAFLQPHQVWEGTAQQLLQQLNDFQAECKLNTEGEPEGILPTHHSQLSVLLRQLQPDLKAQGCRLTFSRNCRERLLRYERIQKALPVPANAAS